MASIRQIASAVYNDVYSGLRGYRANPTMSLGNLKTVGLTAENTALESEDKYLQS